MKGGYQLVNFSGPNPYKSIENNQGKRIVVHNLSQVSKDDFETLVEKSGDNYQFVANIASGAKKVTVTPANVVTVEDVPTGGGGGGVVILGTTQSQLLSNNVYAPTENSLVTFIIDTSTLGSGGSGSLRIYTGDGDDPTYYDFDNKVPSYSVTVFLYQKEYAQLISSNDKFKITVMAVEFGEV